MLKSFIPRYIPNIIVIWVMHVMSWFSGLSKKRSGGNQQYNRKALQECGVSGTESSFFVQDAYIENQSRWSSLRFGSKYQMSYSGCEVIAVYNALLSLGKKLSVSELAELISTFEKKGVVAKGKFGVSPRAAYRYFKKAGYQVRMTGSKNMAVINEIGMQSDTTIVTVYNDKNDIMKQIHTVNISKDPAGKFHVHNGYKVCTDAQGKSTFVSTGPYDTLDAAVKGMAKGNAGVLAVIGIVRC